MLLLNLNKMTELERIFVNIHGETPSDNYEYIIVEDIKNPEQTLKVFKNTILAILENPDLHEEDSKWEDILPKEFVAFTKQLEDQDYKDELLSNIPIMVHEVIEEREWEWFSSELFDDGFEVVISGNDDSAIAWRLIHHLGIPHSSIFSGDEETKKPVVRAGLDVLEHRSWNPKTLKLI